MRSPINIVGGFYKDPNKHWSAQDTLNWIPVKSERSGTRTEWQFRDAPGVKPLVKLGVNSGGDFIEAGPGRGLRNVEGKLFAVAGNTLFQITNDLVSIPYGTIPGVNRVSMAHNQYGSANQLLTVNGSAGYVLNTSTLEFEKITDTGYPGAFIADYIDGYLAQVEPLGRYWLHSDLAEAREYNTLDQYEAEGDPDRIVTLHVANREVHLFGADTVEIYVNAPRGSGIAPFQRAANTVIQCGCSAKFSPRTIAGVVPFLDDKRVVQYIQSYSVNRISTVGIEQALGECSREEIANAYAYTYEDRGHKIYYLTVPGRFTFGYDFLTQEWHRRATSGLPDLAFTDVAFWNGMWVALDRRYGRLYELDWGYKLDSCEPLVRERVTGVLSNNQNRVTVNELELLFNVGTGESVCQPFEEQPEGPTITGDAPDGAVQNPYTPYNYTATGGTPAYRFSLRPGSVLPAGLSLSAGGQITGTPTAVESKTFTVRVTDANGLYDDLEDTITIAYSMLAIRDRSVAASNFGDYLRGGNGTDWDGAWVQFSDAVQLEPVHLIGSGTHIVAYALGGNPRYTTDYGETWQDSGGDTISTSGGVREHCEFGTTILIAGGTQTMARSTDRGMTFTNVAGSPLSSVIAGNADLLVSIYTAAGLAHTSTDEGLTWVAATSCPLFASTERCGALFNGRYYFGGAIGAPTTPGLVSTEDGAAWSTETLPAFAVNAPIACAQVGLLDDEPTLVIITEEGEIAYFDPADDTFKLANDVMGVPTMGLTYNGAIWAAIGSDNTTGVIKYSQNVLDWTTGVSTPTAGVQSWVDIASMGAT